MSDKKASFSLRMDHLALILSPLAIWFNRPSAWYDVIDWVLYGFVTLFILLVFAVGAFFLWAVHQPMPWIREQLKEGVLTTNMNEAIVPSMNKPDAILTSALAAVVWMFALLSEDCVALFGLLVVGCAMFALAVPQGRRITKQLKEVLAAEAEAEKVAEAENPKASLDIPTSGI